jgi:polysaccharide export outer membrane protein
MRSASLRGTIISCLLSRPPEFRKSNFGAVRITFGENSKMVGNFQRLLFFIFTVVSASSCNLMSEVMFKPPKDYVFNELFVDSSKTEYTIQPYDIISFTVFTNEGAIILEQSTGPAEARVATNSLPVDFTVNDNGEVEFPVIGVRKIGGLTVQEAQDFIEDEFEKLFNRPYVIIRVQNRQVVIFTSPDGTGRVVQLGEQYVSVVEAIARAGGAGRDAKAANIMLFRKIDGKQVSYLIDLSKIEGIKYASAPVESGDIIYVQSRPNIPTRLSEEIRPFLVVFTSASISLNLFLLLAR